MKKKKPESPAKARIPSFNVKAHADIRNLIQKKADKHSKGNFSEWVRVASLNYEPDFY